MDFLRRLAPLRDTDATRAVAVLPSRFSSVAALRSASAPAGAARSFDEGDFVPSRAAATWPGPSLATVPPPQVPAGGEPSRVMPPQAQADALHSDSAQPRSLAGAPSEAPTSAVAIAANRAPGDRQFTTTPRQALPAEAHPAPLAAAAGPHTARTPAALARIGAPLSQAVVAQRAPASSGDGPVVHVTIGRIDVVAGPPPPAPAARRGPKAPRPAAVSLADYLRAGSRR